MNLVIILTVCTVLLIYCNHSWQQIALAADLEFQRAVHMQNFYRCEGLLNYGKVLFKQNYSKLKALEAKTNGPKKQFGKKQPESLELQPGSFKLSSKKSQILYTGPWPLLNLSYNGQLTASFNSTKKNWVLHSTLLNQAGHILCQISCTLELVSISRDSEDPSKQQLKISHWVQD
jgi:hypothetical protein